MSYGDLWPGCDNGKTRGDPVALDASPATVLRSVRGPIVDAHVAYPDVLHVEVRDAAQHGEHSSSTASALPRESRRGRPVRCWP